ncbi:hypothetical protein [Cohnella sp. WQ 127256]|uniref:hypothetical protein n=1 Tax=Cohnella sp. WQ 127256 TaxID=2938790 RepID=UPI0021178DB3|nr:hypothetical protein [Cohnella sp. WQ 127256]
MVEEDRITSFQLYQFDDPYGLPDGECTNEPAKCRYGLLRITCCGHIGWGECILSENIKYFDLVQWASFLQYFNKPTLKEAFDTVDHLHDKWGRTKAGLVRSALNDLYSQLQNDNYVNRMSVNSQYCMDTGSLIERCRAHYEIV